jgi:PAS domain S-box-containing protein
MTFSASLEDMLGLASDHAIGMDFSWLAPDGSSMDYQALLESAKDTGSAISRMVRIRGRGNTARQVYVSVCSLRDSGGRLYSYIVTISSEEGTEVPAIIAKEFGRIFRFSNDAVCVTDRTGRIIDVNNAFLGIYGFEREELLGQNPRIIKSGRTTRAQYEMMWADILSPGKGWWRGEIINKTKDGREVPVLLSINAIKDEGGEIRGFLGIAFDLSEHLERERLTKLYIDYFIHDLRGPLTSIMTNTELLLMQVGPNIPERARLKLLRVLEGSKKINAMVSDMLDYSRARAGALKVNIDKALFSNILKSAMAPFEGSISPQDNAVAQTNGKGKRLVLMNLGNASDEDRWIDVDADKVQRAIYNLLSNAFKHADKEVRIEYELMDEGLALSVSDDGMGISGADIDRIFELFYQTDEGIKTGGAGLGLNIVKCFVELHGGRVWVRRREKGMGFGFFIPLAC